MNGPANGTPASGPASGTPANGTPSTFPERDGADEQFRLARIQAYNWGTFDGRVDVSVAHSGYLFVGPSASGKSTLLDAHAAVLKPRAGSTSTWRRARPSATAKIAT